VSDKLHLMPTTTETISQAAVLHDIGKLTIPARLWLTSGDLTTQERALVQDHARRGKVLLQEVAPAIDPIVSETAFQHHEAFDGTGYPNHLPGRAILFTARLVSLCDVYVALRERRPYKPPLSHDETIDLMLVPDPIQRVHRGMFDPALLDLFLSSARSVCSTFEAAEACDGVDASAPLWQTFRAAAAILPTPVT
jgi:putative two-component system response regulator